MKSILRTVLTIAWGFFILCDARTQPCNQLLVKPIDAASKDSMERDLLLLFSCSGFDSLDFQLLLKSPVLEDAFIQAIENNKQATYGDWLQMMGQYKQTTQYAEARRLAEKTILLLQKKVRPEEWPQDSLLLVQIGLPEQVISGLRPKVLAAPPGSVTYENLLKSPGERSDASNKGKTPAEKNIYSPNDTLDYAEALRLSKQLSKPVLLFFSGFGAVNARKMEDFILSDPAIGQYISEHFIAITLYVDDRTPLPAAEQYESPMTGKIKTAGARNSGLQMEKFHISAQPYFFILDASEKILAQSGYCKDKATFKRFLEEGFKAFGK